jgi:hypothetical protein
VLNIYCTGHKWSSMVCKAFAIGAKAPIVPPFPLLPGDMFTYGCLRGLLPTILQAQREGRTWYLADNGYFKPGKNESSYFRITRNDLQHTGRGELPYPKHVARARWAQLKIPIQPWRAGGKHVLVCPPLRLAGATWGYDADEWLRVTLKTLRKHTPRELRVRLKMSWNDNKTRNTAGFEGSDKPTNSSMMTPMADDLIDCHAVVVRTSNCAVEAVLAGVPVFCTHSCAAEPMGLMDLAQIESPVRPEGRERWAALLASNQWSLAEMRSGFAWKMLNESAAIHA